MPTDQFAGQSRTMTSPATDMVAVTPDDANDLPMVSIALNVASPGKVRVTTQDGSTGDLSVSAGVVFPVRARRVWATGTTATGICALY